MTVTTPGGAHIFPPTATKHPKLAFHYYSWHRVIHILLVHIVIFVKHRFRDRFSSDSLYLDWFPALLGLVPPALLGPVPALLGLVPALLGHGPCLALGLLRRLFL